MKTISNIIPNPLNTNNMLNTRYSTNIFATSDYDGKSNTNILKNNKNNLITNKLNDDMYVGGIGEIGIIMENSNYLNDIIKENKGQEIPLKAKYASSTSYGNNDSNQSNNIWYYDGSYGMISHGSLKEQYHVMQLYKYDVKDFQQTIDEEYDEYDNDDLYLSQYIEKFDLTSYIYYCQNDMLDHLTNTMSYYMFSANFTKSTIETDILDPNHNIDRIDGNYVFKDNVKLYVKVKQINCDYYEYIKCKILNYKKTYKEFNVNNRIFEQKKLTIYFVVFEYNNELYCIYTNYKDDLSTINIDGYFTNEDFFFKFIDNNGNQIILNGINTTLFECEKNNSKNIACVYEIINENNLYNELNTQNLVKYPIYSKEYNGKKICTFPLLPSYKIGNYYDCEFYICIPKIERYSTSVQELSIDDIYNNLRIKIKFGDNELVEILDPFVKLADCIIYKFKKQWLFDYQYIHNQELVISLLYNGTLNNDKNIILSKKYFFNVFKILFYEAKDYQYDCQFKFNNYYPLKYPLPSKQKYLNITYIPLENVQNFTYEYLDNIQSVFTNDKDELDNFKLGDKNVNIDGLINNYAYLNSDIYHNLSEGNNITDWFTKENGNGLMIDNNPNDMTYTYFLFNIEHKSSKTKKDINTYFNIYLKSFMNYDNDGILDSSNVKIIKLDKDIDNLNPEDNIDSIHTFTRYTNMNIYGVKQLLYFPYNSLQNNSNFTNENGLSIFEDYVCIINICNEDVKLFFTDESSILCENTRIVNMKAKSYKIYKPSRHTNYNIIIRNCLLNKYNLYYCKIYDKFPNDTAIKQLINNAINNNINYNTFYNNLLNIQNDILYNTDYYDNKNGKEIITIPIYEFTNLNVGNLILITK